MNFISPKINEFLRPNQWNPRFETRQRQKLPLGREYIQGEEQKSFASFFPRWCCLGRSVAHSEWGRTEMEEGTANGTQWLKGDLICDSNYSDISNNRIVLNKRTG